MIERIGLLEEIPSTSIEKWTVSSSDIPRIPELTVNLSTYGGYVSQGFYRELDTPGATTMATDGLTRCSGLVIFEPDTKRVLVGHLEPQFGGLIDHFAPNAAARCLDNQEPETRKEIILLYGDISHRQTRIEDELLSGKHGPINLRRINVNSGNERAWGFIVNKSTGEIKTFKRNDPGEIATYSVFPPFE